MSGEITYIRVFELHLDNPWTVLGPPTQTYIAVWKCNGIVVMNGALIEKPLLASELLGNGNLESK